MTDQHSFLDSHAPYDGEVCTDEAWLLPEARDDWPFPEESQPEPLSWWGRFKLYWIGGECV